MKHDAERELAWAELHQVSALLYGGLSDHLEAAVGLTAAEHDALWYLANVPDRRARMSDIANRLQMTPSGITRLVDRMEKQSWVTRETPQGNRRTTYAVLTTEGTQAVRRSFRAMWSLRPTLFDDRLTDRDVADLRRVLGKLLRRLDVVTD